MSVCFSVCPFILISTKDLDLWHVGRGRRSKVKGQGQMLKIAFWYHSLLAFTLLLGQFGVSFCMSVIKARRQIILWMQSIIFYITCVHQSHNLGYSIIHEIHSEVNMVYLSALLFVMCIGNTFQFELIWVRNEQSLFWLLWDSPSGQKHVCLCMGIKQLFIADRNIFASSEAKTFKRPYL